LKDCVSIEEIGMATQVIPPSTAIGQTAPISAGGRQGGLMDWLSAYGDGDPAAFRYLMVLRFILTNLIALALLAAAAMQGWVGSVLNSDVTHMVLLIVAVFAAGLAVCAARVIQTSNELNQLKEPSRYGDSRVAQYLRNIAGRDGHSRSITASALRLKLSGRIAMVRHVANSLVFLGLIGTVIGFMMALSGVDPEAAADVKMIGPMVSTLITGMSVALSTTLVGAVLNIWLMANFRLLEGGTLRLLTAIVELGERHVQP
jgi:hypothetical protein